MREQEASQEVVEEVNSDLGRALAPVEKPDRISEFPVRTGH